VLLRSRERRKRSLRSELEKESMVALVNEVVAGRKVPLRAFWRKAEGGGGRLRQATAGEEKKRERRTEGEREEAREGEREEAREEAREEGREEDKRREDKRRGRREEEARREDEVVRCEVVPSLIYIYTVLYIVSYM